MIKFRNKLVYSLPILALFSYYSFFRIGDFNFSMSFLVSIIVIFLSLILVLFKKDFFSNAGLKAGLILILGMILSEVSNGLSLINDNFLAFFQFFFYIILFICSTTKRNHLKLLGLLKIERIFCHIVSVAAILGLLQFVYQLKTGDFLSFNIPAFESVGYNSKAYNNSINLYRSNSIFLEPSFLSIYSSISFLFSFELLKSKKVSKAQFSYFITCSLIGLMVSLSGSGLLIILCFFMLKFLLFNRNWSSKEKITIFTGAICSIMFFLFTFNNSFLYNAIWSRLYEISNHNSSAAIRFVLPLVVSFKSLFSYPFGIGCGKTNIATNLFWDKNVSDVNNTYAKMLVDLGVFGLFFLIKMFHSIIKKAKINPKLVTIVLIFLILNITGNFISSVEFWITMALLLNYSNEKASFIFKKRAVHYAPSQLIKQNF